MTLSAIMMLVFGSTVLYGGLGYCFYKALNSKNVE
ncbi:MetS family NSS transporter small subunit [Halanaerobaculum tunisiense]